MFRPAFLYIGLRYTRAKRKESFISFISLISIVGIALGVMVLITVLSVMNGFDKEIRERVFTMVPPITLSTGTGYVSDWQQLQKTIKDFSFITASAPFVNGEVLLSAGGSVQPAMVNGIIPMEERTVSAVTTKAVKGNFEKLVAGKFNIILGENLAERLRVDVGDKITVVTPQVSLSPAGVIPRFKRFTVAGIFKAGGGFGFDAGLAYIALNDGQRLFGLGQNISGLHLNVKDVYAAPQFANQLVSELTPGAAVMTWADQFGEFFHAVQLEKTMMFLILLLIITVAAFNLVATLVMVVNEKQSDIAILRTFGATPKTIMTIFIVQGGLIGALGTLIGVGCGILLASNVTTIVHGIEYAFNVHFLSSNIYFVNYLPSKVEALDIFKITIASLGLSLLATLYPAWRAASTDPVESLRYE